MEGSLSPRRIMWRRIQMLLVLPVISIAVMLMIDHKLRRSTTNIMAPTYIKLSLIRQTTSCAGNDAKCLLSSSYLNESPPAREPHKPTSSSRPLGLNPVVNDIDDIEPGVEELTQQKTSNPDDPSIDGNTPEDASHQENIHRANTNQKSKQLSSGSVPVIDDEIPKVDNPPAKNKTVSIFTEDQRNSETQPGKFVEPPAESAQGKIVQNEPKEQLRSDQDYTPKTGSNGTTAQTAEQSKLLQNVSTSKQVNLSSTTSNTKPTKSSDKVKLNEKNEQELVETAAIKQDDNITSQVDVYTKQVVKEVAEPLNLPSNVSDPKHMNLSNDTKATKLRDMVYVNETGKQELAETAAKINEDVKLPSQAGRNIDTKEVAAEHGRHPSNVSTPKQKNFSLPTNSTKPITARDQVQHDRNKREQVQRTAKAGEDVTLPPQANRPKELVIPEDFKSLPYPYFHRQLPNAYMYPTNDSTYRESTLGFVHSPKSAGTTMKNCMTTLLMEKGGKPALMSFKTASNIRQDLLNDKTVLEKYYMGDSTLGICDYGTERPCAYITLMREPYERVVSHYYFCKDGGISYPPCDNTLEEFVLDSCSLFFRQTTVQFNCQEHEEDECAGYPACPKSWRCNATEVHPDNLPVTDHQRQTILQYVIDRLDRMFAVIGLMEEFDTSLKLFQDIFGAEFHDKCKGEHTNSGSYLHREAMFGEGERTKEQEIEAAKQRLRENEGIRRCLSEDEKIYKRAKEIFKVQKEKYYQKNS